MKACLLSRPALLWLGSLSLATTGASAPGDLDPTFRIGQLPGDSSLPAIYTFAVQKDDRILLGGSFTVFNGLRSRGLARLLPDGAVDPAYLPNLNLHDQDLGELLPARLRVSSMALLPDNRVVFDAVGLTDINGVSSRGLKDSAPARLFSDGTLDSGFVPGARMPGGAPLPDEVRILAVHGSGEVLIQGDRLRRLAADGAVDEAWPRASGGSGMPGYFVCAGAQSAGQTVLFGQCNAGPARNSQLDRLVRLEPDGRIDPQFPSWQPVASSGRYGGGELPCIRQILVLPDDKLLLLGTFTWLRQGTNLFQRGSVARLHADGSMDEGFRSVIGLTDIYSYPDIPQWNATNSRSGFAAALAPDGRVVIGGHFNGYDGVSRPNLVRVKTDGTIDLSFAPPPPDRWITQVGVQSSGKVIVCSAGLAGAAGLAPFAGSQGIVRLEGGPLQPGPPQIVVHPASQSVTLPSPTPVDVQFWITVLNPVPATIQWLRNGSPLNDGTNVSGSRVEGTRTPALTLRAVTQADAGRYECVVANTSARVTSEPAFLRVNGSASPVPDSTKPLLRVTSPGASSGRTADKRITFHGTASDNFELAHVLVQREGGPFQPVRGLAQWHSAFDLAPGTNRFAFRAVDLAGNTSMPVTRTLVLVVMNGFSLTIHGLGNVTRPTFGASLEASRTYTLQASPKPGNLFSNWIVNGVSYLGPTFRFVSVSDLEIVANFVPNPFQDLAGSYSGLFLDAAAPDHANAGLLSFKVNNQGALAGKGFAAGQPFTVAGRFDLSLQTERVLTPPSGGEPAVRLQLASGSETVTGAVALSGRSIMFTGYRVRRRSDPADGPGAPRYNVLLVRPDAEVGEPLGHGYARIQVAPSGAVRLNGLLGDGTPLVMSGAVSAQGHVPVYVPFSRGQGSVFGWLTLAPAGTSDVHGRLSWTRLGSFTNSVALLGSRHEPSLGGQDPWLDFDQGVLIREGGGLAGPATNSIALDAAHRLSIGHPNSDGLLLTLQPATGLLAGRFIDPVNGRVTPLHGVILRKQGLGGGLYKRTNQAGAFFLGPLERYPLRAP